MDQATPPRRRSRFRAVALGLALVAVAVFVAVALLRRVPATRLLGPGTPLVRLNVSVIGEDGHPVRASSTRIGEDVVEATPQAAPGTPTPVESTPDVWRRPSPTTKEPAERHASIKLRRAPIAISIYALRGSDLLQWIETNPTARSFFHSDLVEGVFADALKTLRVRGEDLKLSDVNGPFLAALVRDVVSAGAVLHYDLSRGRRGYVLAFDRARSAVASRLLPVALGALARREYLVSRASLSVVEVLIGEQSLFVAESDGTVYVGNSLSGVLNAIEVNPGRPSSSDGTVAITVRAEALLLNLLPLAVGANEWQATWSIDLSKGGSDAGTVRTSGGKMFGYLTPQIADGVLAAIPRDIFAAAAASIPYPKSMSAEDWDRLAREGLKHASSAGHESAGIGIIWELSAKNPALSDVGIIFRRPDGGEDPSLDGYFTARVFRQMCGGDTVWLAATSELLLTRMQESCDRQSPSMLDWRQAADHGRKPVQVFVALNLAPGLHELLESGIAGATAARNGLIAPSSAASPEWKQSYLAAVERSRTEASTTLGAVPSLVFQGQATERGGTLEGTAEWTRQETAWRAH